MKVGSMKEYSIRLSDTIDNPQCLTVEKLYIEITLFTSSAIKHEGGSITIH